MSAFSESGKKKAVTFSYDDAVSQDIRLIELLNTYGLKCTFNLNSGKLGKPGMLMREGKRIAHYKIAPEDVAKVYDGHEVAVHTITHPVLTTLSSDAEVIRQVEEDRIKLSELCGYEVVGMAYPGGGGVPNNDDRVAELIKNNTGVKYARTTTLTTSMARQENLYRFNPVAYHLGFERMMEYGKKLIEYDGDEEQILYIWGHAYEMDYAPDYWIKLEEFFKFISCRDDIFYGTNKEILLP